MTKRRPVAVFTAVLASFSLAVAACGGDDDDEPASEPAAEPASEPADEPASEPASEPAAEPAAEPADEPAAAEGISIAIVSPSARNDAAFSQSIVDAVNALDGVSDIQISDGLFVVEDAAAAIRGYAEEGVDLVIAHGSQYGAPLQEIAPDFPDTAFAWGTSPDTFGLPNVSAYTVRSDQGGYVMGVLAAELSQSDSIGIVGPIEVGDAKLYVDGFAAGAMAQNPDIDVNINYIESFSDVQLAQEAATAFVANGADILTGTAQMVVGATGVATAEGIPWFGTQSNQTSLGPDIVVASQVYHWEVVLDDIVAGIGEGTLGGGSYLLTLENDGLVIEFNDGFDLDAALRELAETTAAGIADGSISTGIE